MGRRFLLVGGIVLTLLLACGGTKAPSGASGNVIKMAHNSWLAANLNDTVAKILLEEKLGYAVEFVNSGTTEQFPPLSRGELHVSLEVWPAGHLDDIQKYIHDEKTIEDGGPLGPLAKVGWFIPTYMLDDHPELATWDGFKLPANAALFRTPETGDKGRFLGGDPGWVQTDQTIIDNLGLNFKVIFAGSEEALLSELESAYNRRAPILMYFWIPHWAIPVFDLTNVLLPPYSDECWAKAKTTGVACDYPTDHLFKIIWPGLKDYAPSAYRFFRAMGYTTKTQLDMMSDVKVKGQSVEQTARAWIAANEAQWGPWIAAAKGP